MTTIVTGIWDIKRDKLTEGWSRTFDHYLNHLDKLLKSSNNFIIYIEKEYEDWVWQRRDRSNTSVIVRDLDWFKSNIDIYGNIQKIRVTPEWFNQVGWLPESTQAKLEMYNPIVMSKMFLLNDAAIFDPFNSSHLVWVDGALSNTVHDGYFWHDKVFDKLETYFNKFSFVCFPYDGKVEIHGFKYDEMCKYAEAPVDKVARGGIFGGPKESIAQLNQIYYGLLVDTLSRGLMGTEESLFTIMTYRYPELIQYYEIENNGLLGIFFENLKNNTLTAKVENFHKKEIKSTPNLSLSKAKTNVYILTFNFPEQLQHTINSMEKTPEWLSKPHLVLLDNSTLEDAKSRNQEIASKYNFEYVGLGGNRGI